MTAQEATAADLAYANGLHGAVQGHATDRPAERLRAGELFSGYGGLALAVEEVFGAETAWHSEFEAAPSKILAHHWPEVPNHGDVTSIDWTQVEPVDIISGGSPCQDLSLAGARRGMTEGTRSNLWESMREAIATIKPTYVVWENVRGALSAKAASASDLEQSTGLLGNGDRGHLRALGRVLGDLADLGYDCQWRGLRAADVGAPHGRFRIFILATHRDGGRNRGRASLTSHGEAPWADAQADRSDHRSGGTRPARATLAPDTNDQRSNRCGERPEEDRWGQSADCGATVADADHQGPQRPHHTPRTTPTERHRHTGEGVDWGRYAGAVRQWEAVRGTAPAPIESTPRGGVRLSADFAEWMMGLPAGWVTDVPGVSRNDQLKALGNGVVPQQAAAALRDMLKAFEQVRGAA